MCSSHGINKVLEVLNSMRLSVAVSMKRGQKPEYVENTKERQLCVVCYTFKTKHQKKVKVYYVRKMTVYNVRIKKA